MEKRGNVSNIYTVDLSDVKPSLSFSNKSWISRRSRLERRLIAFICFLAFVALVAVAVLVAIQFVFMEEDETAQNHDANQQQMTNNDVTTKSTSTKSDTHVSPTPPYLVFEDNFDTFNFDVWEHEITAAGGGNWEFQYYTNNRTNSYVKDGKLFIKPTLTADKYGEAFLSSGDLNLWGMVANDMCTGNLFYGCQRTGTGLHYINPIQSARLRSIRGFSMRYGKLEVSAKLPSGDWIWPAIWLLPKWNSYGGWPASGEIDLCESKGNQVLLNSETNKSVGNNAMGSTLHFGPDPDHNGWPKAHAEKILPSGTFADSFHKYVLEWDEDGIRTTVDGDEVLNVRPDDGGFFKLGDLEKFNMSSPWKHSDSKMAPFDQEFYIILNVAVGGVGGYWSNIAGGYPWGGEAASRDFWNGRGAWYPTWHPDKNDGEDAALQIDYIRYWKTKP